MTSNQEVESLKEAGNRFFKASDFSNAKLYYTQAIKIDPDNAVLFSNRAATYVMLAEFEEAVKDAEFCIKLRPEWDKGYFRKAVSLEKMQRYNDALSVFEEGLRHAPDSCELKQCAGTLRDEPSKNCQCAVDDHG